MQETVPEQLNTRPRSRPLEGKYYREDSVEKQIRELLPCSARERLRRARITGYTTEGFLSEETVVYFLREAWRNGEHNTASDYLDILMARVASRVRRLVAVRGMRSPQRVEECEYEVLSKMCEALVTLTPSMEFWEVHFWVPVNRMVNNIAARYKQIDERETNPKVFEDGEEDERDFVDTESQKAFARQEDMALIADALAEMPERARLAFLLTYRERWTQTEIAVHLNVTDRTVRNLLGKAEEHLSQWRQTQ